MRILRYQQGYCQDCLCSNPTIKQPLTLHNGKYVCDDCLSQIKDAERLPYITVSTSKKPLETVLVATR
ncbi:MAG: hypothetical protein LLF82_000335 [Dehalococcoides mccartyi]|nr:hypothetical protein [Dehalococcoides mccartyi]